MEFDMRHTHAVCDMHMYTCILIWWYNVQMWSKAKIESKNFFNNFKSVKLNIDLRFLSNVVVVELQA